MATQNYTWPAVSVTATNPSVGTNGITAPTSSTEVGGIGADGNLHAISTDNSGNVNANVVSSALPTGAATAAKQDTGNTSLASIDTKTPALGQALAAASTPVVLTAAQLTTLTPLTTVTVIQPTGTNLHTVVDSSALPTGASTSALQTSGNASLTSILANQTNGTQVTSVSNFPATQPVSGTVTAVQPTGTNLHVVVDSSALPTGAAVSKVDATAFTLGSGSVDPIGAYYSSSPDSVPNGSVGSLRMTQTRSLWTSIRDATGANGADVNASGELKTTVNNITGTVVLPTGASTSVNQTNGTQKSQIATPTALTITQAALTVGTTAVRLTVSGSAPSATRVVLVATPDSTSTGKFYIGSSTVTATGATRGVQIVTGQVFTANSDAGDYWIISDTAAQIVEVMEQA